MQSSSACFAATVAARGAVTPTATTHERTIAAITHHRMGSSLTTSGVNRIHPLRTNWFLPIKRTTPSDQAKDIMRLTIRLKLLSAFAGVLALMALLGWTAVTRTSEMNADMQVFGSQTLPAARAVGELKNQTGKFRRDQLRYATAPDAEARTGVAEDLTGDVDTVAGIVSTFEAKYLTSDQLRAALTAFNAGWEDYRAKSAELQPLTDAGRNADALAVINDGAGDEAWDALKAQIAALDEAGTAYATEHVDEVAADAAGAKRWTLTLLGLAIAMTALVAWLLTRSLSGGINRLLNAARGIADGDVDQNVTINSKDELGDAGREFERMIAYLQEAAATADRIADGDLTHDGHAARRARRARPRAAPHVRQPAPDARRRRRLGHDRRLRLAADGRHVGRDRPGRRRDRRRHLEHRRTAPSASCTRSRPTRQMIAEVAAGVGESAAAAQETAAAVNDAADVAQEGVGAAEQATAAMHAVRESAQRGRRRHPRPRRPLRADRRDRRTPSPAWPSRRTCSRSTPRSRPPAPASRARASPSWPRRSASWPRSPRPRRPRSPA